MGKMKLRRPSFWTLFFFLGGLVWCTIALLYPEGDFAAYGYAPFVLTVIWGLVVVREMRK